jgi:lipid-A-disaccharide synthase-like uncharacterized protein
MNDNTQNQVPALASRNSKILSVIALIGGIVGLVVFIALLIASFFQSFGANVPVSPNAFYILPLLGVAAILIAIIAILKENRKVFAVTGLVLSIVWTIPSIFIGISNASYDISKAQTPSRVCDDVTGYCIANAHGNEGNEVVTYTKLIKEALPYVNDWRVDKQLTAQACTTPDRDGDEWIKKISATTAKSQSAVVGDIKHALEEKFGHSTYFTFKETSTGFAVEHREVAIPSYEDFRLVASVQSGKIEITMNSGCFVPYPDQYQTTIDYDNKFR